MTRTRNDALSIDEIRSGFERLAAQAERIAQLERALRDVLARAVLPPAAQARLQALLDEVA